MRDRRVATRYAAALVAATQAAGNMAEVAESYRAVVEVVRRNPALTRFLEGPQVATQEKKELIGNLLGPRVEPILVHFLQLLIDKNRVEYLVEIGEEFAVQVERARGYARARVTTAVALPDDLAAELTERLAGLTGAKIILERRIDPEVIGGVQVRVGDTVIDGTVRTRLDQLREHLRRTPVR